ncbi:MAG: gliding motility lipoprotein GldD [Bacteroidetes bacterium]|nr:gliding motility lipoprotein GldD [Bacteroidota bacterium]
MRMHPPLYCLCLLLALGCSSPTPYPRPKGYPRMALPAHSYRTLDTSWAPYTLQLPTYGRLQVRKADSAYFNVYFPQMESTWHITTRWFRAEHTDPFRAYEDYRNLVYKHAQKGSIREQPISTPAGVGTLFLLSGNVPSPAYLFFSDTTHYALECSFYFNTAEKNDSLAPVIRHLQQDLIHLAQSVRFKAGER